MDLVIDGVPEVDKGSLPYLPYLAIYLGLQHSARNEETNKGRLAAVYLMLCIRYFEPKA